MASVKYAISAYVADGTTTDYLITWDYLDEDHIAVYVDGTSNADPTASHTFSKLNDTTLRITDELGNAIAAGAEIEIRRETPLTTRAITFADGSALLASDLNKNSDYLLYSMQEVLDTVDAAAQDGALAAQVATEAFRDEAEVFKNDAETAKNTTQGYLATVQSDATDADNHRIAAAASEAASAASEAAAAVSEINSANSATASAASAAASLVSEQAANASEIASAGSATAAAASQVAAAASQAAAASSETNAEAAWDSFDDRYLGAKATAPTLDNDGNALLTGALYWNSTSDTMYVWNGASWDTFNSTTGIADGASSTAITIDSTRKTTFSGYIDVGPVDTTSTYQGMSLVNGKDSSVAEAVSFIDTRNNLQTPDAHMFFHRYTNGGTDIVWGTTSGGDRSTDRRQERMRLNEDGELGIGVYPSATLHVNKGYNSASAFPSGNWAAKVFNQQDAVDEGGLIVANRYANTSSTVFEVGGLYDAGNGYDQFLKVDGGGNVSMGGGLTSVNGATFRLGVGGQSGNRTVYFDGGTNSGASVWWGGGTVPQFAIDSINGGGAGFWTHVSGNWIRQLHLENNGDFNIYHWRGALDRAWGGYPSITITNDGGAGSNSEFRIHGAPGAWGGDFSIPVRADGGFITGSDARRKTNIEDISGAVETVKQLNGKKFNIINESGDLDPMRGDKKQFGFIAQECKDIIPEAVDYYEDEDTPNEIGYASAYSLNYASVVALLTEAIKEQQATIDDLKSRIEVLEGN